MEFHSSVSPALLDNYLSRGWYRIGPFVFTTDHVEHPEGDFPVAWLRYRLEGFDPRKDHNSLLKGHEQFQYDIGQFYLTEEYEALFAKYRASLNFYTSESLKKLLYDFFDPDEREEDFFPTDIVEVRHGQKLIAAGIIDMGEKSCAGIVNFFDPAYKKYSLGKSLMIVKMVVSQRKGMEYYYPGYIAYGYPKFDYKLFLGKDRVELFDPARKEWIPYSKDNLKMIAEQYLEKPKAPKE